MMRRQTALGIAGVSALTGLVFALTYPPELDLTISSLFGDTGGFPIGESPLWQALRWTIRMATELPAIAIIVLAIAATFGWNPTRITRATLTFVALAWIIVPGLIVNWGLKGHSGRARPRNITDFGGEAPFTTPLQIAENCATNCSFVSGEASALAAVAILTTLFAWHLLNHTTLTVLWTTALTASLLRVAFGGHFFSDVVFAWVVTTGLIALAYGVLSGRK